mmetsp:Transcript_59868/g.155716  ORF Transcript_59868/g.155716 Transcript_59868/m.155716 type:complete len:280 (+) Transcript_59868:373-1212(+)
MQVDAALAFSHNLGEDDVHIRDGQTLVDEVAIFAELCETLAVHIGAGPTKGLIGPLNSAPATVHDIFPVRILPALEAVGGGEIRRVRRLLGLPIARRTSSYCNTCCRCEVGRLVHGVAMRPWRALAALRPRRAWRARGARARTGARATTAWGPCPPLALRPGARWARAPRASWRFALRRLRGRLPGLIRRHQRGAGNGGGRRGCCRRQLGIGWLDDDAVAACRNGWPQPHPKRRCRPGVGCIGHVGDVGMNGHHEPRRIDGISSAWQRRYRTKHRRSRR